MSVFFDNKKTPVFTDSITICHAGDIVGNGLMLVLLIPRLEFRRQQPDIRTERAEEFADNVPCLCAHARYFIVPVKMLPQKLFELLLLLGDFPAEPDQGQSCPNVVQSAGAGLLDIQRALSDQISRQGIDHAPHGFMDQPPARDFRILLSGHFEMARKYTDLPKLLQIGRAHV